MADQFKREMLKRCGPGGTKCPCCNSYFGKNRTGLNRLARIGLKNDSRKEINSQLADIYEPVDDFVEEEKFASGDHDWPDEVDETDEEWFLEYDWYPDIKEDEFWPEEYE